MADDDFIERIDSIEDFVSSEGLVQTDSNEQAYGVIRALDGWHPRVNIITEEYFPEAVAILARVGDPLTPNMETMGFDPAYWGNKLDAYPSWETAWWREVVQNSRDARGPSKPQGPTKIKLECKTESYTDIEGVTVDAVRCSCEDNGVGMDEETLRKAFLSFGGSKKPAGAVGGFGDAKELVIIPWLGYEVHTRDLVARGRHNQFEVEKADRYLDGTRVTAWMPTSKSTTVAYAEGFLDRCYLPHLRITINGRVRKANLTSDRMVKGFPKSVRRYGSGEVGSVAIYHNPRTRRRGVLVRSNGVFMFDMYVPMSKYKGSVLIDLEGNPKDLFDQKRVGFSGRTDVASIVDQFVARMTVDPKSALKKARATKGHMRRVFGAEAFDTERGIAGDVAAKMAMAAPINDQKKWKDGAVSFSKGAIEAIVGQVVEAQEEDPEPTFGPGGVAVGGMGGTQLPRHPLLDQPTTSPGAVEVMLTETRFASAEHAADALKLMAWQPVFLVINEVDYFTVPSDVLPEKMKPTYMKLAELWMEICRFVLMRLGWSKTFGVGWIFEWDPQEESTTLAAATMDELPSGEKVGFLVLNPVKLLKERERFDAVGDLAGITYKKSVRWKFSDDETLKMLCSVAVHEATHMVNGISDHDEAFAAALTENMGAMMDMLPVAKKIRKAIGAKAHAARPKDDSRAIKAQAKKLGLEWEGARGKGDAWGYVPDPESPDGSGGKNMRFSVTRESYSDEWMGYDYHPKGIESPSYDDKAMGPFKSKGEAMLAVARRVVDDAGGVPTKDKSSSGWKKSEGEHGERWQLEDDNGIFIGEVEELPYGFIAFVDGKSLDKAYDSASDAKRAVKQALARRGKKKEATLDVVPRDQGDPMFARLWALFVFAWARNPEEVVDNTYDAVGYGRSLGSAVAGSGQQTMPYLQTMMQNMADDPQRYSAPTEPVKLSGRMAFIRDLEMDGRESYQMFAVNSKARGDMYWDDYELGRLARAVAPYYDLKPLAKLRAKKNPWEDDDEYEEATL
jgi:hypothetical protein